MEDLWYPRYYKVNDYDITVFLINLDDNLLSVGSTAFGVCDVRIR